MARRMLIDTAHPEETRVVVVNGNRIEEFDFEAAAKKPLKGNIYLAKVTRVEPSLQAAFIDYGGNRHGFLAFSEIHPDYYQIPVADRQALVAQQASDARKAAREEDRLAGDTDTESESESESIKEASSEAAEHQDTDESLETQAQQDESADDESSVSQASDASEDAASSQSAADSDAELNAPKGEILAVQDTPVQATTVETAGSDDIDEAFEEARGRRSQPYGRPYKIQEVIKRRQILLVQVVKEERGNKGAALTTYLSLAGRYCVLMPNTARGGGISRKITNQSDRKRLKSAAAELDITPGMGLIVRTAGANRTKAEIKRDYEYLLRVWETVRDLTLKSSAPALVYEEGNLIKRAIRDLYSKEIEAILVDGEEGYKEAKTFMRTLMPSHAKSVQHYKDRVPLFQRFQIESLLDQMFHPTVTLKSGGYIVINQTEALVSIDVNSGRSTREHSIEDTATRTNLEAAEEVARQLRLRDLAGLIVIDFIDMEDSRNNRAVEKRLKDSLKNDRARIQIGRISSFGLLEMSRQRLRAGVLEGSTNRCPHCEGSGIVRSIESAALRALRNMEEEGMKDRTSQMTVRLPTPVALYILNHKRPDLLAVEERYNCVCVIEADNTLPAAGLVLERTVTREAQAQPDMTSAAIRYDMTISTDDESETEAAEAEEGEEERRETRPESERTGEERGEDEASRRRRRRRRRRGGHNRDDAQSDSASARSSDEERESESEDENGAGQEQPSGDVESAPANESEEEAARRRRRRGRRGGRRNRRRENGSAPSEQESENADSANASANGEDEGSVEPSQSFEEVPAAVETPTDLPEPDAPVFLAMESPAPQPFPKVFDDTPVMPEPEPEPVQAAANGADTLEDEASQMTPSAPAEPARKGWWQRRFGG